MYKKICPKCHQPSFSSSDSDRWVCPICSNDLTSITSHDAETRKQSKPKLFIIKHSYLQQNPKLNARIRPFIFESFD
ncbi:hypothetical protein BACCIP111895_02709 [Neobacillus rhizosphaerae]|uniref:Uncharacterized protein n=1 Tax=Neobacillus rhizosphaerae TaxID=2880965 RepID=A0ABM9ESC4_9BACI|nr:hypothetical protein BACCIP111895_02709 [Neobacillus rhizosphaerae]